MDVEIGHRGADGGVDPVTRVAVVFTGGTIASVADPSGRGQCAGPRWCGDPRPDARHRRPRRPRRHRPGPDPGQPFHVPGLLDLAGGLEDGPGRPDASVGAVVVQGTDAIEETSFAARPARSPRRSPSLSPGRCGRPPTRAMTARQPARRDHAAPRPALRRTGRLRRPGRHHPPRRRRDEDPYELDDGVQQPEPRSDRLGRAGCAHGPRRRAARRQVHTTVAAERVHLITAVMAMDGTCSMRRSRRVPTASSSRRPVAATRRPRCSSRAVGAMARRHPGRAHDALRRRPGRRPPTRSLVAARHGWPSGAMFAGTLSGPKARVALALGIGAGRRPPAACSPSSPCRPTPVGLSEVGLVVHGRIATLADDAGFGWVRGDRDRGWPRRRRGSGHRHRGAHRAADTADRPWPRGGRDPGPDRRPSPPRRHSDGSDPGRPCRCPDASRRVSNAIAAGHRALGDPDAWLEGQGWDAEGWGRWPTADELERVAPGRRAVFWAHDHHAYWVSPAALTASAT